MPGTVGQHQRNSQFRTFQETQFTIADCNATSKDSHN